MQKLYTRIALMFVTMVVLISCNKDVGETLEQTIVGKWQLENQYVVIQANGKDSSIAMQIQYEESLEFKSDGSSLSENTSLQPAPGTWVVKDSVVTITAFGNPVPYKIMQLDQTQLKLNVHAGGNFRYLFYYVRL